MGEAFPPLYGKNIEYYKQQIEKALDLIVACKLEIERLENNNEDKD